MNQVPFPTFDAWIESSLKNSGELPSAENLSLWTKRPLDEAALALKNYRGIKEAGELRSVGAKDKDQKKIPILDFLLDKGALYTAITVDIVMNVAGFSILAYDPVSRVGFIACALVVVLFALRAWLKGDKVLWAIFALIAAFLDISLALASTEAQAKESYDASKDSVLSSLKEKAREDKDYVQALRTLQLAKGEGYKTQIDNAVAQSNKSQRDVETYNPKLLSAIGIVESLSSSNIFNAIGNATVSGKSERIVALVFFTLLFGALQLTIISAANKVRREV